LELNVLVFFASITDDRAGLAEMVAPMFSVDAPTVVDTPAVLMGSQEQILETLHERRDRWGVSYYVFQGDAALEMAPIVAAATGS
jgi:hypothetical protein